MSIPLIRQLIREIKFSNKRGESLRWKFDSTMLRKDPSNWFRVWSGVEKIGGFWFNIDVDSDPVGSKNKPKVDYHLYVRRLVDGQILDNRIFEELTVQVNDPATEDDIKKLQSGGEELKKRILDQIENDDSRNIAAKLEAQEQFYHSLPPWRPGRWSVPAIEAGHAGIIVGDRLDMGHFQFVASLHPIIDISPAHVRKRHALILVCRKDFALEGPREAWLYSNRAFKTFDDAKREAESFIDIESKRLDIENDLQGVHEELYRDLITNNEFKRW